MKQKVMILAASLLLLPAFGVAATVPCTTGTLASYEALGANGCSIGSFVFSGFSYGSSAKNETPPSAAGVMVEPFSGMWIVSDPSSYLNDEWFPSVGLYFSVNLSVYPQGSSCPYQPCELQSLQTSLSYNLSASGGSVFGADLYVDGIIYDWSSGNVSDGFSGCSLYTNPSVDVSGKEEDACLLAPASSVPWSSELSMFSSMEDGGTIYSYTETFFVTPEPPAWLLLATVFLIIGTVLLQRRSTS